MTIDWQFKAALELVIDRVRFVIEIVSFTLKPHMYKHMYGLSEYAFRFVDSADSPPFKADIIDFKANIITSFFLFLVAFGKFNSPIRSFKIIDNAQVIEIRQ